MKIHNIEIPPDLTFPELDNDTKARIDALHAAVQREAQAAEALVAQRRAEGYCVPSDEEIFSRMRVDARPLRPQSVNVAALRQLPPQMRAIYAYLYRHDISY